MAQLKLIITAEEEVCEKLESTLQDHALVIETFQNTGNWYSNGETGPEWYTVSIVTEEKNQEEVDKLVLSELGKMGRLASNMFWDKA